MIIINTKPLVLVLLCALAYSSATWSGEWGVHITEDVDPVFLQSLGFTIIKQIGTMHNFYVVKHTEITHEHPSHQIEAAHARLQSHQHVVFTDQLHKKTMSKKDVTIGDPLFPNQWHLKNTGQDGGVVGQDINITSVWNMGYTGRDVRIAIVDDGYEYTHPDLIAGYRADSSYNINGGNNDPAPVAEEYNYHGTSCAGVALASSNSVCGVGAAYGAEGSGIRLIGGPFSDADTAAALTFRSDVNFIYSNSWGPADDGETVEGPGYFTMAAFEDGITNGRGGKGSIFVWAAGNGLMSNDNCNYDGFANHRATIAVGAVGNDGKQSYYSEPCSAMLVTAPSSSIQSGITTTDILGLPGYDATDCTNDFGGTSSACPLVAGVVALMLEANPDITWRDVQYILLSTADKNDASDADWSVNGAGFNINHKYGFGRVNAYTAVLAAKNHKNLPSSTRTYQQKVVNDTIPDNDVYSGVNTSVHVSNDFVVEHVEVKVNIPNFFSAGDLVVVLTSPSGTKSILAEQHGQGVMLRLNSTSLQTDFASGFAYFGPQITINGTSGQVAVPQPTSFACNGITNCDAMRDKFVLVDYTPACNYTEQIFNAQQCGARLVMVVDRYSVEYVSNLYPVDDEFMRNITIPSVMIPLQAGLQIKDVLEQGENVTVNIALVSYKAVASFDGWTFSTVRNWGESSKGEWTLQVIDALEGAEGQFAAWNLTIYGHNRPKDLLPPWGVGIIVGAVAVFIVVAATALYFRDKRRREGYRQMP